MDDILLQRLKNNDKNAFEEFYNQYANYALRVATAVTGNTAGGADAVQETFIRVYSSIHGFDEGKPFQPWFYRILMNECYRLMKKRSKVTYISDFMEKTNSLAEEDEYKFQEYEELYKAVQNLDPLNRVPVVLKYLKGFQEAEIADILGINLNTLKSRLYKGRQKLKKALERFEERRWENGR